MSPGSKSGVAWLVLLVLLQGGCLAESGLDEGALKCSPRDSTVECCLKQNPGQWEKCTGTSGPAELGLSRLAKGAAVTAAATLALNPKINSAERRGVELATDLRAQVQAAIWQCVREAERKANEHYFQGRSPSREQCAELKTREQTWAAYLGQFKHELAWPCLDVALKNHAPGRYLFQPRFRFNEQTGKWEYLSPQAVKDLVSREGMKGLAGTIEPDIVIMDAGGFIVRVYDMKFPCPQTNDAIWYRYSKGRWDTYRQDEIYAEALKVSPQLVSPRDGVLPK